MIVLKEKIMLDDPGDILYMTRGGGVLKPARIAPPRDYAIGDSDNLDAFDHYYNQVIHRTPGGNGESFYWVFADGAYGSYHPERPRLEDIVKVILP